MIEFFRVLFISFFIIASCALAGMHMAESNPLFLFDIPIGSVFLTILFLSRKKDD